MIDNNTYKTIEKFRGYRGAYHRYLYKDVVALPCEMSEVSAPQDTPECREKFSSAMPTTGWKQINMGDTWGGDFCYGWFRAEYEVTKEDANKKLLILPTTGGSESLLFINGKPCGLFDVCSDVAGNSPRLHDVQPLAKSWKAGDRFEIVIESYAGHPAPGTMPNEDYDFNPQNFYPRNTVRTFHSIKIVEYDDVVREFLMNHMLVCQLFETLPRDGRQAGEIANVMREVFAILPQRPWELEEDFHDTLAQATDILKKITMQKTDEGERIGYVGVIGHSHLDTAWQWPVRETLHKAARTFSNALRMMEFYPDYKFIQSSVLYIDWMKEHYPDIYEEIKSRTAEGRWGPNGGAWVEFDNNIPGGEFIIRQFLRGQRYTKEHLGYLSNCFWEPDTFGYTGALPQILKGCGIDYFLTTKLSWNESNKFPHDSFVWRGIDGSEVLTHFNLTHCPVDPGSVWNAVHTIRHKDVTDMKLLAYGYGDGGGGPSYSMQEYAERVKDMAGLPKTEVTTVSDFMKRLEDTAENLPVFSGELYLELHRGTLTQMHDIKRSNRMLEKAIHNLELFNVIAGRQDSVELKEAIDVLLLNQFHDILPGTCIEDVHKVAVYQNYKAVDTLNNELKSECADGIQGYTLFNTLSWERNGQITVDDLGHEPENCVVQRYVDFNGNKKLAFSGVSVKPLSVSELHFGEEKQAECPFTVEGDMITTPFAKITLHNGMITSYICNSGFEAVRNQDKPFNTLYCGEDVPTVWDNWDIDYDQSVKMKPITNVVSSEVVSIGALQLRIRVTKKFGLNSVIMQDIVFYADTPRIDFETVVDWHEKHTLLKAGFDVKVSAETARFETQFGNIKRPTHENYGTDKTQFEVCNHKWTDLSDSRFGVAILNDCKYGVSVSGSDIRLTLHKGGCRPDKRGDEGRHEFTYSLLVHEEAFSTKAVIRPAYELNYPILAEVGESKTTCGSLCTVDCENVIIETVKHAENQDGVIVRLYETEGSHAICNLQTSMSVSGVYEADMLESEKAKLTMEDNSVQLVFHPFEIKTIKFKK